jgi:hypothetical protein
VQAALIPLRRMKSPSEFQQMEIELLRRTDEVVKLLDTFPGNNAAKVQVAMTAAAICGRRIRAMKHEHLLKILETAEYVLDDLRPRKKKKR